MKIRDIQTTVVWGGRRNWVLVKISTDKGLYGWGEATLSGKEKTMEACVKELGQRLINEDPLKIEYHWQRLYRHDFWRGGAVMGSAISGIDQALWDIQGKAWGVPVYLLLGGPTRERIRLYTHVGIYDPEKMVEDAQQDMADGFTAVKTGSWQGDSLLPEPERVERFTERVRLLRDTVGPAVDIMIDDHGRGRPSSAVRLMKALEPFRLLFLEEPTQPDDIEGLARLCAANPAMDIAAGERLYTKWDFRPLLEKRLVDVIQPDICHAGGITECKKIAAMAEAYYVQFAPHNPQGPVSTAATAHLCMAIPNFLILEFARQNTFCEKAMREGWVVNGGHLEVPDRPGLGIEIDEDALLSSPYQPQMRSGKFAADGSVVDV